MPLALGAIIAAGVVDVAVRSPRAGAGSAARDANGPAARPAAATSLTAKAVAAANAFKASLSAEQRSAVQFAFSSPAKRKGWSNLPTALSERTGVKIADRPQLRNSAAST